MSLMFCSLRKKNDMLLFFDTQCGRGKVLAYAIVCVVISMMLRCFFVLVLCMNRERLNHKGQDYGKV